MNRKRLMTLEQVETVVALLREHLRESHQA